MGVLCWIAKISIKTVQHNHGLLTEHLFTQQRFDYTQTGVKKHEAERAEKYAAMQVFEVVTELAVITKGANTEAEAEGNRQALSKQLECLLQKVIQT